MRQVDGAVAYWCRQLLKTKFGPFFHCKIIIGTNIDSICKSYVILSIRYIPRNSVGFINRIPRYIRKG